MSIPTNINFVEKEKIISKSSLKNIIIAILVNLRDEILFFLPNITGVQNVSFSVQTGLLLKGLSEGYLNLIMNIILDPSEKSKAVATNLILFLNFILLNKGL